MRKKKKQEKTGVMTQHQVNGSIQRLCVTVTVAKNSEQNLGGRNPKQGLILVGTHSSRFQQWTITRVLQPYWIQSIMTPLLRAEDVTFWPKKWALRSNLPQNLNQMSSYPVRTGTWKTTCITLPAQQKCASEDSNIVIGLPRTVDQAITGQYRKHVGPIQVK